nr:putative integron gene cassette protein [uncultured bacterium]
MRRSSPMGSSASRRYTFRFSRATSNPWFSTQSTNEVSKSIIIFQPNRRLTLNSFLPMPCASYQCSSALTTRPLRRRISANPFILRHLALPWSFWRRFSSRIEPLTAIASTSLTSPSISKNTPTLYSRP